MVIDGSFNSNSENNAVLLMKMAMMMIMTILMVMPNLI